MEFSASRKKAIVWVLLIFALGIAIGAVGTSLVNRRVYGALARQQAESAGPPRPGDPRGPGTARLVKKLTSDLDLNLDQQKSLTEILQNTQARYDAVREQMNPEFDRIRGDSRNHIREILTPEQRVKFEDFMKRVDEDRHRTTPR